MKNRAVFFLLFISYFADAQIDTIPFTLDKKLLVFKGKINGEPIDFAFDTGASVGVANSRNVASAKIEVLKSKKKVLDANQNKQKISFVKINELEIGSHQFKDPKDVLVDMNFLACNNLYLLGQNVIKSLHWKIDFEKMTLYISKNPFETDVQRIIWPIKRYISKRPMVECTLGGVDFEALVDFGFAGVFDVNQSNKVISEIFVGKKEVGGGNEYITANMGLFGMGTPSLHQVCDIDSLTVGKATFNNINASIIEDTDTKFGVGFFRTYCKSMILDFQGDKIYIEPSGQVPSVEKPFDVKVMLEHGTFKVYSKNLDPTSSASVFEIGEQISAIDGKKVGDFKSECDFFNWYFFKKESSYKIEKLNGEIVEIGRGK